MVVSLAVVGRAKLAGARDKKIKDRRPAPPILEQCVAPRQAVALEDRRSRGPFAR